MHCYSILKTHKNLWGVKNDMQIYDDNWTTDDFEYEDTWNTESELDQGKQDISCKTCKGDKPIYNDDQLRKHLLKLPPDIKRDKHFVT